MTDHDHSNGGDEGEYPDATHLYIRTNPADDGSEPLAAGLAFWQSPDIVIIKPNGSRGTEAVADAVNQVEVTVTNDGGIPATDAFVDVFFGDPSTVMTPATTTLIGGGYVSIPAISTASATFPWTPSQPDAGHRCLLARVSLVIPPDTYVNGTLFDVTNDRHIAQRNIHVVAMTSGQKAMSFSFRIANPNFEESTLFTIQSAQIRRKDPGRLLTLSLGCEVPPRLADGKLSAMSVRIHDPDDVERRSTLIREATRVTGPLHRSLRLKGESKAQVELEPGGTRLATVTLERNPDARPGEIDAIDILQIDSREKTVVGGLTVVLQYL